AATTSEIECVASPDLHAAAVVERDPNGGRAAGETGRKRAGVVERIGAVRIADRARHLVVKGSRGRVDDGGAAKSASEWVGAKSDRAIQPIKRAFIEQHTSAIQRQPRAKARVAAARRPASLQVRRSAAALHLAAV